MNISAILTEAVESNQPARLCKHAVRHKWFSAYKIEDKGYQIDRQYKSVDDIVGVCRRYKNSMPVAVVVQWLRTAKIIRPVDNQLCRIRTTDIVEVIDLLGNISEERIEDVVKGAPKYLYFVFAENS